MLEHFNSSAASRRLTRASSFRTCVFEAIEPRLMLAGNGLAATYFDNDNLTGKTVTRVDAAVNFDWGTGGPASGIASDTFSARWVGQIDIPKTETYTFSVVSDDGVRLYVDNKLVINNWTEHAAREDSVVLTLQGGRKYDLKLEYFDKAAGATVKLMWRSNSIAKQIIPTANLYAPAAPAPIPTPTPSPVTGSGNGLLANYFDNDNLTGKLVSRTDGAVNFNWGTGGPASGIAADTFSARWTGQVLAPLTQDYTFYTQSDDGVRLWVDNKLIINNWTDHATREDKGVLRLEAGKKYDIKLEYYDRTDGAVMKLLWSGAGTAKQVVPTSQLFSTTAVTPPSGGGTVPVPTGGQVVSGLLGTFYGTTSFSGNAVTRVDSSVAYDWGTSSPDAIIGSDGWSARWVGQIQAPRSENVTFHITSDDGARMWVNGKLIINDWTAHGKRESSGSIYLEAGKKYDVQIEYYDVGGSATMQLRWSSPSIGKQFVPTSALTCTKPTYGALPGIPPAVAFAGYKVYTHDQVNFRPTRATDKDITISGYNISKVPIDHKGFNIAATDLGSSAWAFRNLTIRDAEISGIYRTPGYHNDFIRIAGAAGRQDVATNIVLENIKIHDGEAIPILITDGDYDTIVIRNVSISNVTVAQVQINTQQVGSVKRIIVENSPGLAIAIMGRVGTVGEALVRNSPGARIGDSLNKQGTKSGVRITYLP